MLSPRKRRELERQQRAYEAQWRILMKQAIESEGAPPSQPLANPGPANPQPTAEAPRPEVSASKPPESAPDRHSDVVVDRRPEKRLKEPAREVIDPKAFQKTSARRVDPHAAFDEPQRRRRGLGPSLALIAPIFGAVCLLALFAGATVLMLLPEDDVVVVEPEEAGEQFPSSTNAARWSSLRDTDERLSIDSFRKLFLRAHGGEAAIREMSTISLYGEVELDGTRLQLVQHKGFSGNLLMQVENGAFVRETLVNPNGAWEVVRLAVSGEAIDVRMLEGKELVGARRNAKLFHPLTEWAMGDAPDARVSISERRTVNRDPWLLVRLETADGYSLRYEVDRSSGMLLALESLTPEGSVDRIVFSDYRQVGEVPVPYHYEYFVDGELKNVITADRVLVNQGIMPVIFEDPEIAVSRAESPENHQTKASDASLMLGMDVKAILAPGRVDFRLLTAPVPGEIEEPKAMLDDDSAVLPSSEGTDLDRQ
ncbi:MAG: hypothetical protein ACFB21_09085 [Opitutales bacterium]